MNIKKRDVFLVSLDPTIGKEIQKTRPAVVTSNDIVKQIDLALQLHLDL